MLLVWSVGQYYRVPKPTEEEAGRGQGIREVCKVGGTARGSQNSQGNTVRGSLKRWQRGQALVETEAPPTPCHFVTYDLTQQAHLTNPFFSLARQNEISQFEKLV